MRIPPFFPYSSIGICNNIKKYIVFGRKGGIATGFFIQIMDQKQMIIDGKMKELMLVERDHSGWRELLYEVIELRCGEIPENIKPYIGTIIFNYANEKNKVLKEIVSSKDKAFIELNRRLKELQEKLSILNKKVRSTTGRPQRTRVWRAE